MCVKSNWFAIQFTWLLLHFFFMQDNKIADIFLSLATYFPFIVYQSQTLYKDLEETLPLSSFLLLSNVLLISLSLHFPWHPSLSALSGFKDTRILTLLKQTNQKALYSELLYSSRPSFLFLFSIEAELFEGGITFLACLLHPILS